MALARRLRRRRRARRLATSIGRRADRPLPARLLCLRSSPRLPPRAPGSPKAPTVARAGPSRRRRSRCSRSRRSCARRRATSPRRENAQRVGGTPEMLHPWMRRAEGDRGERVGSSMAGRARRKALEREVGELRQTSEILQLASGCCSAVELDRRWKRSWRRSPDPSGDHREANRVEPIGNELLAVAARAGELCRPRRLRWWMIGLVAVASGALPLPLQARARAHARKSARHVVADFTAAVFAQHDAKAPTQPLANSRLHRPRRSAEWPPGRSGPWRGIADQPRRNIDRLARLPPGPPSKVSRPCRLGRRRIRPPDGLSPCARWRPDQRSRGFCLGGVLAAFLVPIGARDNSASMDEAADDDSAAMAFPARPRAKPSSSKPMDA